MSDISIPGLNSRFNTGKLVADLVKAESVKLDRLNADAEELASTKKIWLDMNRLMVTVRNTARNLYNFESPFTERNATSSQAGIVASANRTASEGQTRIEVVALAQTDRFASKSINKDTQIPEGTYTFTIGEETISMRYRGGLVRDFADSLSRRGDGRIKASLIQNTSDSHILVIEGLKTGSKMGVTFLDDAVALGLKLGMLAEDKGKAFAFDPSKTAIKAAENVQAGRNYKIDASSIQVNPLTSLELPFPADFSLESAMVLEYEIRSPAISSDQQVKVELPTGPQIPSLPGAGLRDLRLPDKPSLVDLPNWEAPGPPPLKVDNQVVSLRSKSGITQALSPVSEGSEWTIQQVELGKSYPGTAALLIHNNNSLRNVELRNIKIHDPNSRGLYKPLAPISTAQDAHLKIEGIDVYRDNNIITDAIPGVTLTLNDVTSGSATIKVEPDRKLVKEKLIEFVAQYNGIIREINILTARKGTSDVVDEVGFFTDPEREAALVRVGKFQGDSTLNMIKSRLQTIVSSAYPNEKPNPVVMLATAGISTNASQGSGQGVNPSRLRGYLEINEKILDQFLVERFWGVKDLFGRDSDGDLISDRGVGVEFENYIRPYVQTGGILASKTNLLDSQIKQKGDEVKKFQAYLVNYEAQLKVKYGRMEGAVNSIENSSRDLQNLGNNNNNR